MKAGERTFNFYACAFLVGTGALRRPRRRAKRQATEPSDGNDPYRLPIPPSLTRAGKSQRDFPTKIKKRLKVRPFSFCQEYFPFLPKFPGQSWLRMTEAELEIIQFLKLNPDTYFARKEISRKARRRQEYEEDPHWASAPLGTLVAIGFVEQNESGHYKLGEKYNG